MDLSRTMLEFLERTERKQAAEGMIKLNWHFALSFIITLFLEGD